MRDIVLPPLGENIEKATIAVWHVKVGDRIEKDMDVLEVVTDKATFNIPSIDSGRLIKILAQAGEEISMGQKLAQIEEE